MIPLCWSRVRVEILNWPTLAIGAACGVFMFCATLSLTPADGSPGPSTLPLADLNLRHGQEP